jgi:hypothetical protein
MTYKTFSEALEHVLMSRRSNKKKLAECIGVVPSQITRICSLPIYEGKHLSEIENALGVRFEQSLDRIEVIFMDEPTKINIRNLIDEEKAKLFAMGVASYINRPNKALANLMWAIFKLVELKGDQITLSDVCEVRELIHNKFEVDESEETDGE